MSSDSEGEENPRRRVSAADLDAGNAFVAAKGGGANLWRANAVDHESVGVIPKRSKARHRAALVCSSCAVTG